MILSTDGCGWLCLARAVDVFCALWVGISDYEFGCWVGLECSQMACRVGWLLVLVIAVTFA